MSACRLVGLSACRLVGLSACRLVGLLARWLGVTPLSFAVECSPPIVERFFGGEAARRLGGSVARLLDSPLHRRLDVTHHTAVKRSALYVERFFGG